MLLSPRTPKALVAASRAKADEKKPRSGRAGGSPHGRWPAVSNIAPAGPTRRLRAAKPLRPSRFALRRLAAGAGFLAAHVAFLAAGAALLASIGCGMGSDVRVAQRILEDHRRITRGHPLPGSQVIRVALSAPGSGATGSFRIEWDGRNYRETFASAGATTIRGIQGERGYFTDLDGVTRVISDPVLAQLVTRSFFWRRAYLFDDAERAKLALGPADTDRISIRLTPHGGNPLLLTFERRTLRLVGVSSPGLELEYESATRWRDRSWKPASVIADLGHVGLPSSSLPDATIGGWSSVWQTAAVEAPLVGSGDPAPIVRGMIGDAPAAIAIDASAADPVRISAGLAERLGLKTQTDVLGRRIASGVRLAIGGWTEPSIHVEVSADIPPGGDAAAGGAILREAIVEFDTPGGRLRLYDPARWVRPEGYYRCVLADDGDRPVGILSKRGSTLRVTAGVPAIRALTLATESAARVGFAPESRAADGLHWGPAGLPPLDLVPVASGFDPAAGEDGALSSRFLLRFRAVLDMVHRWAYLKPESGPGGD